MDLPAFFFASEMDFKTYLADPTPEPSMTSSIVKALLSTAPRKVWETTPRLNKNAESVNKTTFDLGTAAHTLLTGEGNPIAAIDAKAFNTNDAKQQRDEAYAAGKTPILKANMPRVEKMARLALEDFSENPDIGPSFNSASLAREVTLVWQEGGVMHRCRPDLYDQNENIIIHYKTTGTSIAPSELARYAANAGWYLIAAHYEAGFKALTGSAPRQFFAVQETDEPHLTAVAELDNTFLANAHMRRERAIQIWAKCLRNNTWPGYPNRTVKLECPEWLERNLIADKDAEQTALSDGTDLIDMARQWQAPQGWQDPAVMGADEVIE